MCKQDAVFVFGGVLITAATLLFVKRSKPGWVNKAAYLLFATILTLLFMQKYDLDNHCINHLLAVLLYTDLILMLSALRHGLNWLHTLAAIIIILFSGLVLMMELIIWALSTGTEAFWL